MNIKQIARICFQISIAMSLLIANTSIAAAGGGKGDDIIGQVSKSVSASLPTPTAEELEKLGIVMPDASQSIPGGGTAIATAQLSWTIITMQGKAISSLSTNTVGTLSICATATQLYMNGSPQGGAAQVCAAKTGGGSITSTKSKTVPTVTFKTWRVDTSHGFSKSGWSWHPTLTVSVSL